ncbi:MAG: response regulator [Gammaproteobacteria bacterium]
MTQAKILSQLLSAQSVMAGLTNEERVIEFLCQAIRYVPGVAELNACWGPTQIKSAPTLNAYCGNCLQGKRKYTACKLQSLSNVTSVPLRLQDEINGFINIQNDETGAFDFYKPHVLNTIIVGVNILENRRLLKDLRRENERHFLALVSSIPGAIYRFKRENGWQIQFISETIYDICGYPAGRLIDCPVRLLSDIVHPEDRSLVARAVSKAIEDNEPYVMDYRIIHSDGTLRWVQERGQGTSNDDDELLFLEGAIFDITQSKRHETLLIEARNDAEAADRAKTEFLAHMSHELRTPLNGILGYVQLLQLANNLPEELRQYAGIMRRSGEYLLSLIDELLYFSRLESHVPVLSNRPFDLNGLLLNLYEIFRLQASEKGIPFDYEAQTDWQEWRMGDAKCIKQVLSNLLGNAVKFTKRGRVWLKVKRMDNVFEFEVGDTGCGIEEKDLEIIFEPFQQLKYEHSSLEGAGLGLSICRKLVDMMEGNLEVESVRNGGSVFKVCLRLPAANSSGVQKQPTEGLSAVKLPTLKILIVDDNVDNLVMLKRLLESAGYSVYTAANGRECLEKASLFRPDVVLMDIYMPEMDGLETTRRLRLTETGEKTVIIGLSANSYSSTQKKSLEAGCNDFIAKPVRLNQLLMCFEKHFPRDGPKMEPEHTTPTGSESRHPHASILIADDNEINRMLLSAQIGDIGASIAEAEDGLKALNLMRRQKFDLIFLDLHMPGMGGAEIMLNLLDYPDFPNRNTPIVAITAFAGREKLTAFEELGFCDLLIKPFPIEKIQSILRQWIPG